MKKVLITIVFTSIFYLGAFTQTNTTAIGHHKDGSNYRFIGFNNVHVGAYSGYSAASNSSDNVFVGYGSSK